MDSPYGKPETERIAGTLGITGGIGSGKSALAGILQELRGWPLLEADKIGHEALRAGSGVYGQVLERFGKALAEGPGDGGIDREKLGRIVFSSPRALADLNRIVHPFILRRLREEVAALRERGCADIILIDAALLLDWLEQFRPQWIALVRSPRPMRLRRLEGRGLSRARAEERMASQRSMETVPEADFVIDNDGDLSKLRAEAERLVRALDAARGRPSEGGAGRMS